MLHFCLPSTCLFWGFFFNSFGFSIFLSLPFSTRFAGITSYAQFISFHFLLHLLKCFMIFFLPLPDCSSFCLCRLSQKKLTWITRLSRTNEILCEYTNDTGRTVKKKKTKSLLFPSNHRYHRVLWLKLILCEWLTGGIQINGGLMEYIKDFSMKWMWCPVGVFYLYCALMKIATAKCFVFGTIESGFFVIKRKCATTKCPF